MQITQKLEIIIKNYSKFKSLKKKLLLECENCPENNTLFTNIKGTKLFVKDSPKCTLILNWVVNILRITKRILHGLILFPIN